MIRSLIGAALALAALTWSNAQCVQMPAGFSPPSKSVFAGDQALYFPQHLHVAIAAQLAVGR